MNIPSKILENAVDEIATLPGVGKRTALRYALSLLNMQDGEFASFVGSLTSLKNESH